MTHQKHSKSLILSILSSLAFVSALPSTLADDSQPTNAGALKADNSGKNTRDRSGQTMTADRQAEGSKSDVEVTREIRKALTKDDGLSTSGKNVKIITKSGVVSLRGPVSNSAESAKIADIAKNCAGVTQVENHLEVKN